MNRPKQDRGISDRVTCSADNGIGVEVDRHDRMLWVSAKRPRLLVIVGLEDFSDAGYCVTDRTLGIALDSAIGYIEIPCSRRQAENILSQIGWDVSKMHIL